MSSSTVPIHGNYHGYYAKRPSVNDPRLDLLPPSTFLGKRVLDVGCNEGWVSCEIAQSHGASKVLGVDIDDALVRAAWRRRRTVWSTQGPPIETDGATEGPSRKRKRVEPVGEADYFPSSCAHSLGPLPIPRSAPDTFPHNVSFRTADWVNDAIPEDEGGYDIVLAFSITKWIHLNGGDAGLQTFFSRVAAVLPTGGLFLVEPQAWETYRKAKRMDKRLRDMAQGLELRPEDFPRMLAELGFGEPARLGSVGEGGTLLTPQVQLITLTVVLGFHRPVDLYTKL
ncbi:Bicoid-interacting protein 3-domain-containing protein [Mycena maculata]|uniref:RNA methyltransferase n=1 Tax=Mycena maculata TaxID=230809 RepID=A0AAD7MSR7_9AGAR|nr:Bicoid-interacting protein 3-domain-containing protein [Mycena maculata]